MFTAKAKEAWKYISVRLVALFFAGGQRTIGWWLYAMWWDIIADFPVARETDVSGQDETEVADEFTFVDKYKENN